MRLPSDLVVAEEMDGEEETETAGMRVRMLVISRPALDETKDPLLLSSEENVLRDIIIIIFKIAKSNRYENKLLVSSHINKNNNRPKSGIETHLPRRSQSFDLERNFSSRR